MSATTTRPATAKARPEEWLSEHLRELTDQLPEFDARLGARSEILERLVAAVVPPRRWADVVGPVYTAAELSRRLGITRQAIHNRTKQGTLWALATADGHMVYPASQFTPEMSVLPGLIQVLRCFNCDDVDAWTLASWMASPAQALADKSPLDAIRTGEKASLTLVFAHAKRTAARWSH